jgi:hypothetical protein
MMAHDLFGPSEDDGEVVEFFTVKAKGQLEMPEVRWTRKQFKDAYEKIQRLTAALRKDIDAVIPLKTLADMFSTPSPNVNYLAAGNLPAPSLSVTNRP